MSVASGTILAASTVVYNDLYLRFVRGQKHAEVEEAPMSAEGHVGTARDVWVNRIIALALGAVIIILSVIIEDIFKALDLSYGFLSGCVFIPVFAAFILKKVSPRAGLVSLALSFVGVAGTMIYGESTKQADFAIGGTYPIMVGMAIGLVSYVIVHVTDRTKVTPNVDPGSTTSRSCPHDGRPHEHRRTRPRAPRLVALSRRGVDADELGGRPRVALRRRDLVLAG
ncbi:hypothetical protein GCM10028815_12350 [Mariniluteicoccus flavus]